MKKKSLIGQLNRAFSSAASSTYAKWDWEKTTPLVAVKRNLGRTHRLEVVHIGSLQYWGSQFETGRKPSVRLYNYEVLDTRLITLALEKELEEINSQIKVLQDKWNNTLKDKFLELEMVEDSEVEKYYKQAQAF